MGNLLFGEDIAAEINEAMGNGLPDVILTKVTPGERDPTNRTKLMAATETTHGAKGFMGSYSEEALADTSIKRSDRLISVLGDSIEDGMVPGKGDKLFAEGESWEIVAIPGRDPAGAVYECQCR